MVKARAANSEIHCVDTHIRGHFFSVLVTQSSDTTILIFHTSTTEAIFVSKCVFI